MSPRSSACGVRPSMQWSVVQDSVHELGHAVVLGAGRDFFNALSEKDVVGFKMQLIKYLIGFCFGETR